MEFRFDLNEIFQHPIVEIGNTLIPPGFSGDKRALWDTQSKITQIVNAMGEASAHAQGLTKPITTADRLRNSEHRLYLLVDRSANNGKGAVTGMLKTGEKGLYVFDREGQHYQVSPPCVLDFYIHESRQRAGFGKRLFEHMLQAQQIEPAKMAIDRPSEKFLGFLNKHYGLNDPVKQMNNYVVFDGFFPRHSGPVRTVEGGDKSNTPSKKQSANGLQQGYPSSPYGRYGAPRPTCSMGQIIHNDTPVIKRNQEPTGVKSEPATNTQGQGNYIYGSQPAWQATQSVPNMHYTNLQNQHNYVPNQTPYIQDQLYTQNQSNLPTYSVNQTTNDNQNQNRLRIEQQMQNHSMAHGDATAQFYSQRGAMNTAQGSNQNHDGQYDPQGVVTSQSFSANRDTTQPLNPQQQSYYYMPQTPAPAALYQQQNIDPNVSYPIIQQHMMSGIEQQPTKFKEPLIPQNVDGTPRKNIHAVQSSPGQEGQLRSTVILQNSSSAPVNYQQHAMPDVQYSNALRQEYNTSNLQHIGLAPQNVAFKESPPVAESVPTNSQGQLMNSVAGAVEPNLCKGVSGECQAFNQIPQRWQMKMPQMINQNNTNGHLLQADVDQSSARNEVTPLRHPIPANYQQSLIRSNEQPIPPKHSFQPIDRSEGAVPRQMITPQLINNNEAGNHVNSDPLHLLNQHPYAQHTDQNTHAAMSDSKMIIQNSGLSHNIEIPHAENQANITRTRTDEPQPHYPITSQGGYQNQVHINSTPTSNEHYQRFQQFQRESQMIPSPSDPNPRTPIGHYSSLNLINSNQERVSAAHPHVTNQTHNIDSRPEAVSAQNNYATDSSTGKNMEQVSRTVPQPNETDMSKGYPPQHHENSAQNSTPKADRPNSLNIEPVEELQQKAIDEVEAGNHQKETLDGNHEDDDSMDEDAVAAIEQEIQRIETAPKSSTPHSKGSRSPGVEAAGIVTPGRSTPGLTDQGYFDLKFYHNKLW